MRNEKLLWMVKIVATIFNIPATWYVFFDIFSHTERYPALIYFNTIFAILLIDVLFLWVLGELENWQLEPIKRLPVALSAIVLSFAVVLIGMRDEGWLAFVPRVGLLILVFNDLVAWNLDWRFVVNDREYQEKSIRDKEVIYRRNLNRKAQKEALKKLKPEIIQLHVSRERARLGLDDTPKHEDESIIKLANGAYGWKTLSGQVKTASVSGKPYTKRGAKLARNWYLKEKSNGKQPVQMSV